MNSIKEAIKVLNYAIKHNISASKASIKNGYADTYVKNVKRRASDKYENDTLSDEEFNSFMNKWEEYQVSSSKTSTSSSSTKTLPMLQEGARTNFQEKNGELDIEWQAGRNYPADHIRTLDQLLKICNVNPEIWSVKDYVVNKWDVTMNDKKTLEANTYQNFQYNLSAYNQ